MGSLARRNRVFSWIMMGVMGLLLTGCSQPAPEETVIVIADDDDGYVYNLAEVKKGDITLTKKFSCRYMQTKEQEVSFSQGGKKIEKIYVREGDYVEAGDVLAEVSYGSLDEEIAALEYKIKKETLQKQYLDKQEEFALTDSYHSLVYGSKCEEEDVENHEERDEEIRESYKNQREDYDDELEFDNAELVALKKELEESRLYATMSGMVYTVTPYLEGTISQKDEVIMTIIDGTEGVFAMEEPDYVEYFAEGEVISLEITYGSAKGIYEVMPYQISSWDEMQYFSIFDGPENEGIEVDTMANLSVVLDERKDVLSLPNECISRADGNAYVYVLDENNMKTVCWIETGLAGDSNTEIISGLQEGDTVVRK